MTNPNTHGAESALEAMLEVALRPDVQRDYATVSSAFAREDLRAIVDLAWRFQFSDDRTQFKREVRGLQEVIGVRVLRGLGVAE